jgi:hypothetical protein
MRAYDYYGYKENTRHGAVEFPIELYHSRGLIAPYHWHDKCEFVYMNEGSVCCRIGAESMKNTEKLSLPQASRSETK